MAFESNCLCCFFLLCCQVNVENTAQAGVAHQVFGALHAKGIDVTLITEASSQHSVTFATNLADAETAQATIVSAFTASISSGAISQVEVISPCSIIAAVGDGMSTTPGICGRFFDALGTANINVLAIAMGCSGRNVSCVVKEEDSAKALRAVHGAFMLSTNSISVAVIGTGSVGTAMVAAIRNRQTSLEQRYNCNLVRNSSRFNLSIVSPFQLSNLHSHGSLP